MDKGFLTVEAVALLGKYDEFHALYEGMVELYLPKQYDDLERPKNSKARKLLDDFLEKNTSLFTKEFHRIHPNVAGMNRWKMYQTKHLRPLTLQITVLSFRDFLEMMETFVLALLQQRKGYQRPGISLADVREEVAVHFGQLVRNSLKSRVVDTTGEDLGFQSVVVYGKLSSITCNRYKHLVVPDTVCVPLLEEGRAVLLPVHRCLACGRVFIGNETLKVYRNKVGKMLLSVREDVYIGNSKMMLDGESDLHRAGYNVIRGQLTESQRRTLLTLLYDKAYLTGFQICRDIENSIRLFDGKARYVEAVQKWKADLYFISEYIKKKSAQKSEE